MTFPSVIVAEDNRLVPCDGAEASHVVTRVGHMAGAAGRGMRPEVPDDGVGLLFVKLA